MANRLKMPEVQVIVTLRARGWSFQRIGRELGVHGETAARYVRLAEASPEDGSGDGSGENRPSPPIGSGVPSNNSIQDRCGVSAVLVRPLLRSKKLLAPFRSV